MALASPPLLASSWYAIGGNSKTRFFFDAETIEKSKNSVLIWIKTVKISKENNQGVWATASRWQINCAQKTFKYLVHSDYDYEEIFIESFEGSRKELIMPPDSIGAEIMKISCKANFPNDESGKDYRKVTSNNIFQYTQIYAEMIRQENDSAPK